MSRVATAALLICLQAIAGCGDQSSGPGEGFDELAPYYNDEVIADVPPLTGYLDAGIGAFFIRPEDLRRRDFSRVLYTWDNH